MVTMISLFPGETGMVYKGVLMNWKDEPVQGVAVKTLKGIIMAAIYIVHKGGASLHV